MKLTCPIVWNCPPHHHTILIAMQMAQIAFYFPQTMEIIIITIWTFQIELFIWKKQYIAILCYKASVLWQTEVVLFYEWHSEVAFFKVFNLFKCLALRIIRFTVARLSVTLLFSLIFATELLELEAALMIAVLSTFDCESMRTSFHSELYSFFFFF